MEPRLIIALDDISLSEAVDITKKVCNQPGVWGVKINSLLRQYGYQAIATLKEHGVGVRVMADAKLHDIPNTIDNDCKHLLAYKPELLTVHASGGREMIQKGAERLQGSTEIICITVLTSLSESDCVRLYNRSVSEQVLALVEEAKMGGAAGIVCAGSDLARLKPKLGLLKTIIPGIRPSWHHAPDDQKRTMTPTKALEQGATYLVVGRPILKASNINEAVHKTVEEIEMTLAALPSP